MCSSSIINCLRKWRVWIGPLLATLYVITIIVLVPILIKHSTDKGFNKADQGELIGGAFVLLALPISISDIIQHIIHYTKPRLQKHIIRILWMVPIYAVNAWIGLAYPSHSLYVDSIRECYEAFVIYNFMKYLLNFLNEDQDIEEVLEQRPQVYHVFPLCCLAPWEMGRPFVHNCLHGILQYTVIRPLTTVISLICELSGVYGEGDFSPSVAFPYLLAVNNVSQTVAMNCLVLFYIAVREELKPIKPVGKFICIKAVVFFSFFQGVIINFLVYYGKISTIFDTDDKNKLQIISSKLQDFLICIEMFIAAIGHHYCFSHKPYLTPGEESPSCLGSFMAMWDVSDVQRDISDHLGVVGGTFSRRLRGKTMYHMARGCDESSRLVDDGPTPSTSTPNLIIPVEGPSDEPNPRATTYGSINTNIMYTETDPLIDICEETTEANDNPTV